MESIIAYNPDLAIIIYWILVTIVIFGCMGVAFVWTKHEESKR